jgi:hypothetical protein
MEVFFLLVIDLPKVILNVAWGTLLVIIAIILYRLLLRRMKRDVMDNSGFVVLHRSEKEPAWGAIQLYFTSEKPGKGIFRLYAKGGQAEWVLFDGEFKPGNTIVNFDTTKVPNGWYYYEVKTENQKTYKLLEIKNKV